MSKYAQLLQEGSLPEFINYEQATNVADCICDECLSRLLADHTIESKKNDNGDRLINTVSLLEFVEQADKNYIKRCKQDRLKYLKDLKEGKIE